MAVIDALPGMERDLRFFPSETKQPKKLTPGHIAQFNEKGYVFPFDLYSADEADANRRYFDGLLKMTLDAGLDSYAMSGWHTHCGGIYDLVMEDRILDYVEDILGPNIICTMTHYFSKMPGDTKSVYWHQDASFWALTPSKVVTVWLAIDDVDVENGAMKLFPGTHLLGRIPFKWVTDEEEGVLEQHVHNPERYGQPVSVELKAGQISLHTDMLLHGSQPNPSGRRRCGLTLRYFPPDVRGSEPEKQDAIIARGVDPDNYWQHIERPEGDTIPPSKLEALKEG